MVRDIHKKKSLLIDTFLFWWAIAMSAVSALTAQTVLVTIPVPKMQKSIASDARRGETAPVLTVTQT